MAYNMDRQLREVKSKRRRRSTRQKAVGALCCAVVFCVTYALILPAITMEGDTYCGLEQHRHGPECFEKRLICGYDETEDASAEPAETGHVHTDACYEEQQVPVCGQEESAPEESAPGEAASEKAAPEESAPGETSSEETTSEKAVPEETTSEKAAPEETDPEDIVPEDTALKETNPEEIALEDTALEVPAGEEPEEEPVFCGKEEHLHGGGCRDENGALICELEEHTHSLSCRSNPEADVETAEDWKKTFANVELTGSCPEDVLAIARTQLGYAESEKNYAVTTDPDSGEEVRKGYTRYGDWYGGMDFAYEDWCAMFVSFCLHYADIPAEAFPPESGAQTWIEKLSGVAEGYEDYALYREASTYTPKPGDLVFFDLPENGTRDGLADHVGLVSELLYEDAENPALLTGFRTIEGNCGNQVAECRYEISDPAILGCGMLPARARDELPTESLTEEEQAQVNDIIARIDALPTWEEIEETLTGYGETGDGDGQDAYLTEVMTQVSETYAAYSALTDAQRSAVTNSDQLLALAEGLGINGMMLLTEGTEENATQTGGFMGYVKDVSIDTSEVACGMETGTAPFDSEEGPGNDAGAFDQTVRSYDTIKYYVIATMDGRDNNATSLSEMLCFEIDMYKKISEATFDLSTMGWLQDGNATWEIQYFTTEADGSERMVMVEDMQGNLRWDSNGDGTIDSNDATTSFNALLAGSEADNAYEVRDGFVVRQRLVGKMPYSSDGSAFSGRQKLTTGIRVRNAANGDTFEPSIRAYFEKNPENYGQLTDDGAGNLTSEQETENDITLDETYQNGAYRVTVSAAPLFNLMLEDTSEYVNLLSWFDFGSGQEVTDKDVLAYLEAAGCLKENYDKVDPSLYVQSGKIVAGDGERDADCTELYSALNDSQKASLANIRYGRMNALGVTLSLAADDEAGKGYRGCSLPVGDITFDLDLAVKTTVVNAGTSPDTSGYSAILWDFKENALGGVTYTYEDNGVRDGEHIRQSVPEGDKGTLNRNIKWDGIDYSKDGFRVAPLAYRGSDTFPADANVTSVYDSGYWTLSGVNGSSGANSSASDKKENGHSTYTFKIRDYDFDFNSYLYPNCFYGEDTPNTDAGLRTTDYAFFGGYAQVLYVMPFVPSATVTVQKDVTVGNLELSTKGQTENLALAAGAVGGVTVKADNEVDAQDNHVSTALTVYSPGSFTSRSSFNTKDAKNHTLEINGTNSFLGTNFWNGPSWDENIYAGEDISIIGSAQVSTSSDNNLRAVNLLQLFDSAALTITPDATVADGTSGESYIMASQISGLQYFCENPQTEGHNPETTFLFAADPAYPQGYDTNENGVVAHMNTVRENSLGYSDKLYWNETDKCYNIVKFDFDGNGTEKDYVCVGVMMEVRKCNNRDYAYLRIPVTVADDESFVNKTVCTLNTATVWIDENAMTNKGGASISWLNGKWDSINKTNNLEGYETIHSSLNPNDGGVGAAGNGYTCGNNENSFRKVEYDGNGHYHTGVGGPAEGNTLLILGYKAHVGIDDQKHKNDKALNYYTPANNGDDTVTWVVQGIETEISTDPTPQQGITTLTIPVTLAHTEGTAAGTAGELFPIESGTYAITVQNYETDANGSAILNSAGELIPTDTATYSISTNPNSPTEITFLGTYSEYNDKTGSYETKHRQYTYKIYAEENSTGDGVTFQLSDVPVGQKLPDITFQMFLSSVLGNSDKITATAAITGAADKRAYSSTSGNMAQRTINISKTTSTSLIKRVDKERGEMGTDIQYKVTFSNSGTTSIDTAYFYDNLPYDSDLRGTSYTSVNTDSTVMKAVELKSYNLGTTVDTGDFQADVTIYFSTLDDFTLNNLLTGFNGTESTTEPANQTAVEEMLADTAYFQTLIRSEPVYEANDSGQFYQLKPTTEGAAGTYTSTTPTESTLNDYVLKDGSTTEAQKYLKHAFFRRTYAENRGWITGYANNDEDQPVYANGTFEVTVGGKTVTCSGGEEAYRTFLSSVTGIFVKMTNLGPSRDVVLTIDMGTNTNKAEDVYVNSAYNWNGAGMPIRSTFVSTKIYSRSISGRVWVDENLNGVYDAGEKLLNGVTCTLFQWDDAQRRYVPCTTDVKGEDIAPILTGSYNYQYHTTADETPLSVQAWKAAENGELYRDEHGHVVELTAKEKETPSLDGTGTYQFAGLSQGKYIVAFSGGDLDKYGGATSYQIMGGSTDANNDGVALTATPDSNLDTEVSPIAGIGDAYSYVIAFDLTSGDTNQADGVTLKALSEISEKTCMDSYDHQDLGLVLYAGMVLPETGGAGTAVFPVGGLILMLGAGILLFTRRRKIAGETR